MVFLGVRSRQTCRNCGSFWYWREPECVCERCGYREIDVAVPSEPADDSPECNEGGSPPLASGT